MLRICLISGQELPAISSKNIRDVCDLKRELRNLYCLPVCLRKLLHETNLMDDFIKLKLLSLVPLLPSAYSLSWLRRPHLRS